MQQLSLVFLTVLATEFMAEFGDKTQLMLVGMTSKYKLKDIMIGTLVAIAVLNALAVFLGSVLNEVLKSFLWAVKFVAAGAFIFFAVTTLLKKDDDEEDAKESRLKFAPLAVFCTFFLAELGDKTQFTAVTFGANYGFDKLLLVWGACVVGFFFADMIGMLVGYFLKKKAPEGALKIISFVLFAFFGIYTAIEAVSLLKVWLAGAAA